MRSVANRIDPSSDHDDLDGVLHFARELNFFDYYTLWLKFIEGRDTIFDSVPLEIREQFEEDIGGEGNDR